MRDMPSNSTEAGPLESRAADERMDARKWVGEAKADLAVADELVDDPWMRHACRHFLACVVMDCEKALELLR